MKNLNLRIKISRQKYNTLYNMAVGVCMPLVMSTFVTLANNGINSDFFIYYLRTYIVSVVMSVPVSMVLMPLLTKILRLMITVRDIELNNQ